MQTLGYLQLFLVCTEVHNVTGNKYKFAQLVQEPVAIGYKFGHSQN